MHVGMGTAYRPQHDIDNYSGPYRSSLELMLLRTFSLECVLVRLGVQSAIITLEFPRQDCT